MKHSKLIIFVSILVIAFSLTLILFDPFKYSKKKDQQIEEQQEEYLQQSQYIIDYDVDNALTIIYVNDEWMEHTSDEKREFCINVVKGLTAIRDSIYTNDEYVTYVGLLIYHNTGLKDEKQAEVDIYGNITLY